MTTTEIVDMITVVIDGFDDVGNLAVHATHDAKGALVGFDEGIQPFNHILIIVA